jgi:hypothetical protein
LSNFDFVALSLTLIARVFGGEMDGVRMFDHGELRRFIVVGIVNTAFGYTTFALLIWLGVPAPWRRAPKGFLRDDRCGCGSAFPTAAVWRE